MEQVGSRSQAQRLIKEGRVQVQGVETPSTKTPLSPGQEVRIQLWETALKLVPTSGKVPILFEDQYLLVVNKPRGMVVHPSAGHESDSLANILLAHCQLSDAYPTRPGIVHRLDKDTSGLIVIAKTNAAHQALAKQFYEKTNKRLYLALCWGLLEQRIGKVNAPLGRHPSNRKKRGIIAQGKAAVTHWKVVETFPGLSLIECRLETGRTHQVRAHLSHLGHSLIGDPLYGRQRDLTHLLGAELAGRLKKFSGQALHASVLGFRHPETNDWMEFNIDLPLDMADLISRLRNTKAL